MMNAFKNALAALTRIQLAAREVRDYRRALACFPLVGALLGLVLWVAAVVLSAIAGFHLGIGLGALGLPILYWWLTRGRGLAGVAWSLERWMETKAAGQYDIYWRVSAFQIAALLKLLGTGVILYTEYPFWLLVVPVISSTVFAEFCRPKQARDRAVAGGAAGRAWSGHWLLAGAIVLLLSGCFRAFLVGLLSLALGALLVPALERLSRSKLGDWTEESQRAGVEITELITLLIGAIYFLGQ